MKLARDIEYKDCTLLTTNELRRRVNHLSGATVPIAYMFDLISWSVVGQLLSIAVLVAGVLEAIRLDTSIPDRFEILNVFYRQLRSYESESLAGYFYYVLGGLIVWLIFPTHLAVVSSLLVSVGDPISGVLGTIFERLGYDVSFIIPLNFVFSGFLVVLVFAGLSSASVQTIALLGVGGAIAFTFADGYPVEIIGFRIDDNILIPVLTSSIFTAILYLLQGSLYLPA